MQQNNIFIAAAADLVYCIDALNSAFEQTHPNTAVRVSTSSSGNLFAQIKNGAPFDLFLSADTAYPHELVKAGLAEESSLTTYAIGRLALWTTNEKLNVKERGLEILRDAQLVKKIAIANPDHAPYGRAAKAALEQAGLWNEIQDRIVLGENIAQTAQFVQTGNADVGIVSLSSLSSPSLRGVGDFFEIKTDPPIEQSAVLTKRGSGNTAAKAYLEFLRSNQARDILKEHGFQIPTQP